MSLKYSELRGGMYIAAITTSVLRISKTTQSLKSIDIMSISKSTCLFLYTATPPLGFFDFIIVERPDNIKSSGDLVRTPKWDSIMIIMSWFENKLKTSVQWNFCFTPFMFQVSILNVLWP